MKKNWIFITLIFLLTIKTANSQVQVGYKFDINGQAFNGFFDPFIYAPLKKLDIIHNSDSYEVGYYYDSLDNKVNGLIKFENKKIWFKNDKNSFADKIKPDEVNYFVIGVDSFFVVKNFYFKNKLRTKPEFVQYISEIDGNVFAKHYHFASGMAQSYAGSPPIIESFLVRYKDSIIWDNFYNTNFKEKALKYFGHIPYLEEKISSGQYKSKNMMSIIKMAEYYNIFQQKGLIYFDKYWQETRNSNNSEYYARITDTTNSTWTLNYFKDSVKLYEANYSSFYPNTKNGQFISYHENNTQRQIIDYKDDKPINVKVFDKSGILKSHYEYFEIASEYETEVKTKYISVIDSLGNNQIDSTKKTELNSYDSFSNEHYVTKFQKNEIVCSYRLSNTDTIFQITNPNHDFKIERLQRKLDEFLLYRSYDDALKVNAQGTILVSFVLDKKGYVVDYLILNYIHPQLDKLVSSFINNYLTPNCVKPHKFKPYKKNKEKQYCEVVIPFEFSINRFYRRPVNYNNFNNMYWHMQQPYYPNFTPPTAPRMPSGF